MFLITDCIGCLVTKQLSAKLIQVGANNPSTPDSSSGSSTGSLHNVYDGPNLEAENCLPGVVSINYNYLS